MAFGIKALADDRGSQMSAGYLRVAVALWIVTLVAGGYAESFPDRPTAGELDEIVELGTGCFHGVNERCWATQYQTNPVQYRAEPFTNTAGFYLDQSLMGAMASKIKSLVPFYVDTNTVYDGTTNIAMLTVTGLWAQLKIGNWTNQFTCTPAIGTNAATYGDAPWRIYATNLQERCKVLNALKQRKLREYVSNGTNFSGFSLPPYNQAKYKGNSDGATNNGHLYYGNSDLDLATNNEHTILIDNCSILQAAGFDYITLGDGSSRNGVYVPGMALFFDRDEGQTNPVNRTFTAQLELSASEDIVGIYNVICVEQTNPESTPSAEYTRSSVNVEATLRKGPAGQDWSAAGFVFFPILTFPFQYCTDW